MLKVLAIGSKNQDESKIKGLNCFKTITLDWHSSFRVGFSYNYDAVLVFNEWKPSNRIFIHKLKNLKIPVMYLVDGIIDWNYLHHNWSYIKPQGTFLQPLVSDFVGVIGNDQRNILSSFVPLSKIEVVGMPRLDNFKVKSNHRPHLTGDVLIITPSTPYLNNESKVQVSFALKCIKDFLFKTNRVVEWRIRGDLATELDVKSNLKTSLKNQINRNKCVISFSSTVIIESMLLGKPTGLIDFSNNPNLIQTPWLLKGKENLSDFFNSILNPSKEHLSYQETCLNRLLYRGKSCKKLINTLHQISKNPPPYTLEEKFLFDQYNIEPRKKLDFDQNDLRAYILDAYSKQNDLNVKTLQILMTRINEFTNDTRHYKEISKQHIHSFLKRIHDFVDFYK